MLRTIRTLAALGLRTLIPRRYWQAKLKSLQARWHEPELRLLPFLVAPEKVSVDVGAADGVYLAHMLPKSARVVAFEPRPQQAADLEEMRRALALPIQVEAVALSDQQHTARLRMLIEDPGRSTIEPRNSLEDPDQSRRPDLEVSAKRLDDYEFHNVGFIKIDVEGHEFEVLSGASQTIARERPAFLVEIEERHSAGAISSVFSWMRERSFAGSFLLKEELVPASEFRLELHQNPENIGGWRSGWARKGIYINNFVFVPAERQKAFLASCVVAGFEHKDPLE